MRLLGFFALVCLVLVACIAWRAGRAKPEAQRLLALGRWDDARENLKWYLWLRPGDPDAHLLMAEALVMDDGLPTEKTVREAIAHLQQIPDVVPQGVAARVQEARLSLLILQQPARAEHLLQRALAQDRNSYEALLQLWKIYDLTGRLEWNEDLFWRCYELAPEPERAVVLRDWYMSQFAPGTACASIDRPTGVLGPSEEPSAMADLRRLVRFRDREPESPTAHAALARWFLLYQNAADEAIEVLREASAAESPFDSRFFVATLTTACLELGWYEQAKEYFARWPNPREGYHFWKLSGIIAQEVDQDFRAAISAYNRALQVWPGEMDWQLRFRKAHCLTRVGDIERALSVRQEATEVQKLMETSVQREMRTALAKLDDPHAIMKVEKFYRDLGRNREAACWRKELTRLRVARKERTFFFESVKVP